MRIFKNYDFQVCGEARPKRRKFGLVLDSGRRYDFAVFSAESTRHSMLSTQSGRTQFERWRCERSRKASSYQYSGKGQFQNSESALILFIIKALLVIELNWPG
jgi:hypothetical protein